MEENQFDNDFASQVKNHEFHRVEANDVVTQECEQ